MSETMNDIQNLELQIENAKQAVAVRDKMNRLIKNADFRDLITEGFLKEECARFAHMSTDPNIATDKDRADALGTAQAAGYFKRWVNAIIVMGNNAENDIASAEGMLEDLRSEDNA